jgi:hypothetical protein
MEHRFKRRRKLSMGIFTWWRRKKACKIDSQLSRDSEKDVCSECGGKG